MGTDILMGAPDTLNLQRMESLTFWRDLFGVGSFLLMALLLFETRAKTSAHIEKLLPAIRSRWHSSKPAPISRQTTDLESFTCRPQTSGNELEIVVQKEREVMSTPSHSPSGSPFTVTET